MRSTLSGAFYWGLVLSVTSSKPQGKSSYRTFPTTEHGNPNKLASQKWVASYILKTRNSPKPVDSLGAVCCYSIGWTCVSIKAISSAESLYLEKDCLSILAIESVQSMSDLEVKSWIGIYDQLPTGLCCVFLQRPSRALVNLVFYIFQKVLSC